MKYIFTFLFLLSISSIFAQNLKCNEPMVGSGYVVDKIDPGLVLLLNDSNSLGNLLDGDLTNYCQFNLTAAVAGASIVSVKKVSGAYDSGAKVGFVVETPGSLLTVNVLSVLAIRTYRNNIPQELIGIGTGSGLATVSLISTGSGGKRNIEFQASQAFDEVELVLLNVASALSNLRVYNAYVSDASCNQECMTYLTTTNFSGLSTETNPVIVLPTGFINPNDVLVPGTSAYASRIFVLGDDAFLRVNTTTTFAAGTQVGFEIEQVGLLGLLNLNVLSGIKLTTYNAAGQKVEELDANASLAGIGVLSNGRNFITMKTTAPFRDVRIDIVSVLSLATTYRIYRGFVVLDNDNDGIPNCIDRCIGNDNIVNENGIPTACQLVCTISAGADVAACPESTESVQLNGVGTGATWSALSSNPSAATVSGAGLVQGMQNHGVYNFVYSNSVCSDTVAVRFENGAVDASCNRPLVQPNVVIDHNTSVGGICLLCSVGGVNNVIDGNLNNYLQYNQLASIASPASLMIVKDTSRIYQAGNRVGYVVSFPDGLLSVGLLDVIQIRTYLDNQLQEIATGGNGLLSAGVLAGVGNKARIGFVAGQPFNKVELVIGSVVNLLTTIRVHNAFVEPESCEDYGEVTSNPSAGCFEILTTDPIQNTQINYDRTGFSDLLCALCKIDSISNIIDSDYNKAATLVMTAGVGTIASVSVKSKKVFSSGYEAGYTISTDTSLVKANLLSNFTIVTYLNGVLQETASGSSGLLSLSVLPGGASKSFVGFRTTKSFNEVRFLVSTVVSASVLSDGLEIYYAYARLDSDGDGVPDCMDKCCSGNDDLDADGDGYPDACDRDIKAENDSYSTIENQIFQANVLDNDEFGYQGLASFQISLEPSGGTVSISDNGTPDDPTDDYIVYTPDSNYFGLDSFKYTICDSFNICSEGLVYMNVQEGFKALNDSISSPEDEVVLVDVLANDHFGVAGSSNDAIEIITPPQHGTASVITQNTGTPLDDRISYEPHANYHGPDSLVYQICDAENVCLQAAVYFDIQPVNDAPVAVNDTVNISQGVPTVMNVLDNDTDSLDAGDGGLSVNTLSIVNAPDYGTAIVQPNGTITYTSNGSFIGVDSLVYEICDVGYPQPSACAQATVYINVVDGVYAENDIIDMEEDNPQVADVLQNDAFGPAGPKSGPITIIQAPEHGTAVVLENGTPNHPLDDKISYTPDLNYNGTDSLVYEICDVSDNCKTATVYFEIAAVNDAPVASDDFVVLPSQGYVSVDVLANDQDLADGVLGGLDKSTLKVINQPMHGNAVPNTYNGHIIYTGEADDFGYDTVIYSISDIGYPSAGFTDTAMLVIRFGEPDLSPSILILPSIIYGASTISIILEAHEMGNAPTDGSDIFLVLPKDEYMNINFQNDTQTLYGYNVDNANWEYLSSYTGLHVFKTNIVIPANGIQRIGITAEYDPLGSTGRKPMIISVEGGGESNLLNNTDVETLIFFGN